MNLSSGRVVAKMRPSGPQDGAGRKSAVASACTGNPTRRPEEYTVLLSVTTALASHFAECTSGLAGSISLILPYPPSVNHIWRKAGSRTILDPKAAAFRHTVCVLVNALRKRHFIPSEPAEGKVAVMVEYNQPDRRRRDLDNGNKALLDSLTYAGIWKDDSQVVLMLTYFGTPRRHGECRVLVQPLEA